MSLSMHALWQVMINLSNFLLQNDQLHVHVYCITNIDFLPDHYLLLLLLLLQVLPSIVRINHLKVVG